MYNEEEFLILQFNQRYDRFEDITAQVEWVRPDQNAYEIKYCSSETIYHKRFKDIVIYDHPKEVDLDGLMLYRSGKQLNHYTKILKFGNWYKLFFENGKISSYEISSLTVVRDKKSQPFVKNFLDYLKFIASAIAEVDGNDFLLHQLEELSVPEGSVLYKFLVQNFSERRGGKAVLLPFSFNESQKLAVKAAMENELSVIQGPPGTGKTQTILNIVANCVARGECVAVVSGNNVATQNVYEKLDREGYGFLNAFLGNDKNLTAFFSDEPPKFQLRETEKKVSHPEFALKQKEELLEKCLFCETELARKRQLIEELSVEKEVNDTEYSAREHTIPQSILRKKYNCLKLLELSAFLELIPREKLRGVFQRLRIAFRYGLWNAREVAERKDDAADYLKNKYYSEKLRELTEECGELERFLKSNDSERLIAEYRDLSRDIFDDFLRKKFSGEASPRYSKESYREHFSEFANRFPIIYSTTHALRFCTAKPFLYDCVVIDESGQVDLITATIAFSCAKRVILVGDEMQIGHVVPSKLEKKIKGVYREYDLPESLDYFSCNILRSVRERFPSAKTTMLNEHYRCDPQIIEFCNKRFYNGKLIVKTHHEEGCGVTIYSHRSHAELNRRNETEGECIGTEIIPSLTPGAEIGIIAPYNNQIDYLKEKFSDARYNIETVHKFQGKECENIILSAVTDRIKFYEEDEMIDFMNQSNLINVAISRAKRKLFITVSEEILQQNGTILHDLLKYNSFYCSETKVIKSKVYSVFDLLYDDYAPVLEEMNRRLKKISEYKSENIVATVIEDVLKEISAICEDSRYGALAYRHNFPLKYILKTDSIEDPDDKRFVRNPNTHCDFVIYNTLDKSVELVVEVDGKYPHSQPEQIARDRRKDRLLSGAGIKLLRLSTTAVRCREKILEKLLS